MLFTSLGARQDPTPSPRQSFCNYLHSEIEHLEKRDFLTFRNETVKLLSEIQYKAKEHKREVTTNEQVTTLQLSEATQATVGRGYIPYQKLCCLHSSCAAYTDCSNKVCYSYCQSTATIEAFISFSTANF